MSCNLDPVNMCCWTHGVDIDEDDYVEGVCAVGYIEEEMEADEEPYDYDDAPQDAEATMRRTREQALRDVLGKAIDDANS